MSDTTKTDILASSMFAQSSIETVDGAVYDYLDGLNIFCNTSDGWSKIPIIWSSAERSYQIKNNKNYLNHRIIFVMFNGYLPEFLDHIDGNSLNNKIENLREATQQQNCINRKHHSNSKSPYKNVYWNKAAKKWQVYCRIDGHLKYFGIFEDLELADLVAQEARAKYHGEFARFK